MTYRIVVGVDGSPHSEAAPRWSLAETEAQGREVAAVFAWQVPFMSFPGAFDPDDLEQAAKQFIVDTVSRVVPTPAIPLWTLVAEGDPAESLTEAAKGASLLVLGTPREVTADGAAARLGELALREGLGLPLRPGHAVRRGNQAHVRPSWPSDPCSGRLGPC